MGWGFLPQSTGGVMSNADQAPAAGGSSWGFGPPQKDASGILPPPRRNRPGEVGQSVTKYHPRAFAQAPAPPMDTGGAWTMPGAPGAPGAPPMPDKQRMDNQHAQQMAWRAKQAQQPNGGWQAPTTPGQPTPPAGEVPPDSRPPQAAPMPEAPPPPPPPTLGYPGAPEGAGVAPSMPAAIPGADPLGGAVDTGAGFDPGSLAPGDGRNSLDLPGATDPLGMVNAQALAGQTPVAAPSMGDALAAGDATPDAMMTEDTIAEAPLSGSRYAGMRAAAGQGTGGVDVLGNPTGSDAGTSNARGTPAGDDPAGTVGGVGSPDPATPATESGIKNAVGQFDGYDYGSDLAGQQGQWNQKYGPPDGLFKSDGPWGNLIGADHTINSLPTAAQENAFRAAAGFTGKPGMEKLYGQLRDAVDFIKKNGGDHSLDASTNKARAALSAAVKRFEQLGWHFNETAITGASNPTGPGEPPPPPPPTPPTPTGDVPGNTNLEPIDLTTQGLDDWIAKTFGKNVSPAEAEMLKSEMSWAAYQEQQRNAQKSIDAYRGYGDYLKNDPTRKSMQDYLGAGPHYALDADTIERMKTEGRQTADSSMTALDRGVRGLAARTGRSAADFTPMMASGRSDIYANLLNSDRGVDIQAAMQKAQDEQQHFQNMEGGAGILGGPMASYYGSLASLIGGTPGLAQTGNPYAGLTDYSFANKAASQGPPAGYRTAATLGNIYGGMNAVGGLMEGFGGMSK